MVQIQHGEHHQGQTKVADQETDDLGHNVERQIEPDRDRALHHHWVGNGIERRTQDDQRAFLGGVGQITDGHDSIKIDLVNEQSFSRTTLG